MSSSFQVKLLSEKATAPTRGSALAAGFDIYSSEDAVLKAKSKGVVETDIAVAVPIGYYGRVAPRSGLALKHGIDTGAGVVDSDYRGPIKVILFNHSPEDYHVKKGDRVAQMVIEKIYMGELDVVETLDDTARGQNGFGSTGYGSDIKK